MYTIIKMLDGSIICLCRIQDGTERYTAPSLKAAKKWMIEAAYHTNHAKISVKDIILEQEVHVTESKYVPWKG